MWRANWMSLGIIVTLFACMAQRLASSMRDTKNASAASCKHIMALPWKCKWVLPTAWAILPWEGEFSNEELGTLLELPDLLKSNCARPVLPGLLYFSCFKEFLPGALPPMVGQSFLLAGSSPKADGLASAAIWANCQVGNDDGDRPTSCSHLASSTQLSALSIIWSTSLMGEGLLAGEGWCTGEWAHSSSSQFSPLLPSWQSWPFLLLFVAPFFLPSPFWGWP